MMTMIAPGAATKLFYDPPGDEQRNEYAHSNSVKEAVIDRILSGLRVVHSTKETHALGYTVKT